MPQRQPTQEDGPLDTDICPDGPGVPGKDTPSKYTGVSAADTHPLSRPGGVLGISRRHTERQALLSDDRVCIASGYKQRKEYTKCPKLAAVKNINKANPSLPRRLATFICMFMSIC